MTTRFTYSGNDEETYTIYDRGEVFAVVDAGEDNVMHIMWALNGLGERD